MATSLTQAVDKNVECPVCLNFFKEPKNLTCSHTFCKGCLENILVSNWNRGVLVCPTCRGETRVPGGDVGRLQSNITVRSLVEDVETQVHSNCNQKDKSFERKWNKCSKHSNYDEECFCLDCNKYVCCKCGALEHTMNAHTILEAGAHETEQRNHVLELASKADAKIRDVDKHLTVVEDQRKRVHNVQEQLKDEIDGTFEESVQIMKERKTVLQNEVKHGQLGNLKTSLGDMENSGRKQIDQIKKALDLVKNGLNFPLQTEALTSHRVTCQQLEELLSRIEPNGELPRRIAEDGDKVGFRSQGSDGLQLGQLRQKKSKWDLRVRLPVENNISGMEISPNNEMAVWCNTGGILIYSSAGIIQDTVLKSVDVRDLHFMPDGGYVIRDTDNRITLYTEHCGKLDVKFETMPMDNVKSGDGCLTVGKDGLIFIGSEECEKIEVFSPEGGKAFRKIDCNGFKTSRMFAMASSQAIVVTDTQRDKVHVIDDVSGAIIHSISKVRIDPYPAVYQDNSVIIAWVKWERGVVSIDQYTKELKFIKNLVPGFKINLSFPWYYHLLAFKTGEIAFCTEGWLYIFHETLE